MNYYSAVVVIVRILSRAADPSLWSPSRCADDSPRGNRLAEKFEYGGGKALPEEMTFPAMAIPSEERWKASEAERVARVLRRRKGLHGIVDREIGEENAAEPGPTKNAAPPTNMFDQVIMSSSNCPPRSLFRHRYSLLSTRRSRWRYNSTEKLLILCMVHFKSSFSRDIVPQLVFPLCEECVLQLPKYYGLEFIFAGRQGWTTNNAVAMTA